MFKAFGDNVGNYNGLNSALATAGGDSSKLKLTDYYWSSTEDDKGRAYFVNLTGGNVQWFNFLGKGNAFYVRACLEF